MGDLIRFPTPAASTASYTAEVWRGCWACGLVLFDDELELCASCDLELNRIPVPAPAGAHPSWWYLKHLTPAVLQSMAVAIVDTGTARAEERAAVWARDHELTDVERARYVGGVRGRATVELSIRCHDDAQQLGAQLGWWRGDR